MTSETKYFLPSDRYYDFNSHLWIKITSDDETALIGIDTIGLDSLGELAYVALSQSGRTIKKGESIGSLEAAKMVSSILSPVSGEIVEVNQDVIKNPILINNDPYNSGWLIKIKCGNLSDEKRDLIFENQINIRLKTYLAEQEK